MAASSFSFPFVRTLELNVDLLPCNLLLHPTQLFIAVVFSFFHPPYVFGFYDI